jgi:hypothetical protein
MHVVNGKRTIQRNKLNIISNGHKHIPNKYALEIVTAMPAKVVLKAHTPPPILKCNINASAASVTTAAVNSPRNPIYRILGMSIMLCQS